MPGYDLGFRSLSEEIKSRDRPVERRFPQWLSGQYIRNGPGLFESDGEHAARWFDGLAILTGFSFDNSVTYTDLFLRMRAYRNALADESSGVTFAESSNRALGRLRPLIAGDLADNANGLGTEHTWSMSLLTSLRIFLSRSGEKAEMRSADSESEENAYARYLSGPDFNARRLYFSIIFL